jgi:dCMP deaminase
MRKPWNEYFLDIADMVATRSTCDRANVGAVIVRDKRILATGYNGSISGEPHCDDEGHLIENGHCIRTIHAEVNALAQCARFGISTENASIYVSHKPCRICERLIKASGISDVIYRREYGEKLKAYVDRV